MFQERFYEQVGTPLCTLHRQIHGFEGIILFPRKPATKTSFGVAYINQIL
jgi:hypothetical protein